MNDRRLVHLRWNNLYMYVDNKNKLAIANQKLMLKQSLGRHIFHGNLAIPVMHTCIYSKIRI